MKQVKEYNRIGHLSLAAILVLTVAAAVAAVAAVAVVWAADLTQATPCCLGEAEASLYPGAGGNGGGGLNTGGGEPLWGRYPASPTVAEVRALAAPSERVAGQWSLMRRRSDACFGEHAPPGGSAIC